MRLAKWVRDGIRHPWTAIYLKVIAVLLFLGALVHLGSIIGIAGTSWTTRPIHIRVADTVMLTVNLVVGWGLWRTRFWAVVGWVLALLLLHFIPFIFFTDFFATNPQERTTLYVMLAVDASLLGVFFLLLLGKRGSTVSSGQSPPGSVDENQ
jgi:hypothetical protein